MALGGQLHLVCALPRSFRLLLGLHVARQLAALGLGGLESLRRACIGDESWASRARSAERAQCRASAPW